MLRLVLIGSMCIAAASLGCGSSTDDGGKGNTAGNSSGSAGSGNTFVSCADTHCPNELTVATTEGFCDNLKKSMCYSKYTAWAQCRISNEKCTDDGEIDRSTIAVCDDEKKALNDCTAAETM